MMFAYNELTLETLSHITRQSVYQKVFLHLYTQPYNLTINLLWTFN